MISTRRVRNGSFWHLRPWLAMLIGMSDVTHILSQIESGNPSAAEQLLPLVYNELPNPIQIPRRSTFAGRRM